VLYAAGLTLNGTGFFGAGAMCNPIKRGFLKRYDQLKKARFSSNLRYKRISFLAKVI
jgi:hypothetical protein